MKDWMEQLLILHGAKPLTDEDDDPVFLSGSDSEDGYQEDDILSEIIKKLQSGEGLDSLMENEDQEEDIDDEEIEELEIVSIEDATTGEQIPFKIDGEDYQRMNESESQGGGGHQGSGEVFN